MMVDGQAGQAAQAGQAGQAGSGPLYERGEAGRKAAEEPVTIPGSGSDDEQPEARALRGGAQTTTDRNVDPPP